MFFVGFVCGLCFMFLFGGMRCEVEVTHEQGETPAGHGPQADPPVSQ